MAIKVGINGFGRHRPQYCGATAIYYKDIQFVAGQTIFGRQTLRGHLLKYDPLLGNRRNTITHNRRQQSHHRGKGHQFSR